MTNKELGAIAIEQTVLADLKNAGVASEVAKVAALKARCAFLSGYDIATDRTIEWLDDGFTELTRLSLDKEVFKEYRKTMEK